MHILLLTQFYPPEFGAASVRLGRLAQMLVEAGHTVTVLTSMPNYPTGIIPDEYKGRIFTHEQQNGVQVFRVWVYASPQKSLRRRLLNQCTFMLTSALRGIFLPRPDVILVESHPLFVCLSGGWLSRIKRAPIILNVSDLWPESAVATGTLRADSGIVKIAKKVERWAYRDASHVIGMTEGVVQGINAVLQQPEKVTFIQNAVDTSQFHPGVDGQKIRESYGLGNRVVAVHVGNMSLTYDFDLLLACAEALPEITFLFVGDGSQGEYVRAQVQERGLVSVIMTGIVPHADMPEIWAAADIALVALRDHSVAAGTRPAKMFEAMATGTPVVAAAQGETQRLLESTGAGIAVQPGDRSAMIDHLQSLANDPHKRETMALAGRQYALQNLSAFRVRDSFLKIFTQVVEGNSRH